MIKKSFLEKAFEVLIVKSWWVIVFLVISYIGFDQGMKKRNKDIFEYIAKFQSLSKEKTQLLDEKEDLMLKINSQSDPAWIELVLMKELGVVPDGKIKVHFKK